MPMERRRLREGEVLITLGPRKRAKLSDWDATALQRLKVRPLRALHCHSETLTLATLAQEECEWTKREMDHVHARF